MSLINKLGNISAAKLGNISIALLILPFLVIFFGPVFAGQYKYLKNSHETVLTDYEYVEEQSRSSIYIHTNYIYVIKQNDTYYAIHYYYKNKVDYDFSPLSKGGVIDGPLYLPVHPRELKDGKGTKDNPIRVMNYGYESKKYVWERHKHTYNIRQDFVHYRLLRHDIFGDWVYNTYFIILFIMLCCSVFYDMKNKDQQEN